MWLDSNLELVGILQLHLPPLESNLELGFPIYLKGFWLHKSEAGEPKSVSLYPEVGFPLFLSLRLSIWQEHTLLIPTGQFLQKM